jgi:glycosyltransferase involved in cell wall biosynthesis
MSIPDKPHVSIVTPVYNCEPYLAECIESVLAQTYSDWDYTIVNNCSTDRSLEIAEQYAQKDSRIRIHRNKTFLAIMENANNAVRQISPRAKYCKNLSADDWMFPECIARMVEIAEANPSVGLVGSYQLSGGDGKWYVRTFGLPYSSNGVSGFEIGRAHLLGKLDVLGNPTSSLYRSDLIRRTDSFYPNTTPEADISACFECLKVSDFGFVHQVLSFERLHPGQITNTSQSIHAYFANKIGDLRTYGPFYLGPEEQESRINELMDEYYEKLALSAIHFRGREFWAYHRQRLRDVGSSLSSLRLTKAISTKLLDLLLNPKETTEKVLRRAFPKLMYRRSAIGSKRMWRCRNANKAESHEQTT